MKFIWKIENFSHLKCECLQSPSFSSHDTMWELRINPNSDSDDKDICVKLEKLDNKNIALNYSFAFLDYEGSPFVWIDKKTCPVPPQPSNAFLFKNNTLVYNTPRAIVYNPYTEYVDIIKRHNIFGSRKSGFLPNDILTLQCLIWGTVEELHRPVSIFAQSRVESAKVVKKFDCNINKADLFQDSYILEQVEPITNDESLMIKFFINKKNSFTFEFKVSMFFCKMEVKILLLDAIKMRKIEFSNDEFNFNAKGAVWPFDTKISKHMIMFYQNLYLPNDTLTLHLICSFSKNVTFNRTVDENEMLNIPRPITPLNQIPKASVSADKPKINQPTESLPPNTVYQALQDMFNDGFLSDFNLRAGDRVFPIHRSILGMRSHVFRAMFTTEMKEKVNGCVDIPDVDEGTLQRLLQFIYTDKLDEDMGWESVSNLYAVADKYALDPLKQQCSARLQSGLCVPSVLEVLSMADMHQDQDLKSAALDFISMNDEVFGSDCWVKFEKENVNLALDTFRSLYFKKINV